MTGGGRRKGKRAADDLPSATIYWYGSEAHDGAGFYYVIDEYPDEGSCGAFRTVSAAVRRASLDGYIVSTDASARRAALARARQGRKGKGGRKP